MCGRFVRKSPIDEIVDEFEIDGDAAFLAPSYNIAPGQQVLAVVNDGGNQLVPLRWGLVPSWAEDDAIGSRLINARAEGLSDKPSFRAAFARRRCLVVADGFFEWQRQGRAKMPVYFSLLSGKPLGFAGLYERWRSPAGQDIGTCAVVTTTANGLVRPVHDRMPAILARGQRRQWLDPDCAAAQLLALLGPYPHGEMRCHPVGTAVNSPKHDAPDAIVPVADPALGLDPPPSRR
jgi:putative SOS response-associated peptidase YedK